MLSGDFLTYEVRAAQSGVLPGADWGARGTQGITGHC